MIRLSASDPKRTRLASWPNTDPDRVRHTPSTATYEDGASSKIVREKQDDDDDQDYADQAVAAMAVAGTAEATTEAAEQEDHEYDNEDEPERHERSPSAGAKLNDQIDAMQNQCFAFAGANWVLPATEQAARVQASANCYGRGCTVSSGCDGSRQASQSARY